MFGIVNRWDQKTKEVALEGGWKAVCKKGSAGERSVTRAEARARLVCGRSRGQRAREAGAGSWGTEDLEGQGGKTGFYSESWETFLAFSIILLGSRKNLLR